MIGEYFYHETLKSATAAFGSLFNNIVIRRRDGKVVPVPLAYGPRTKWLEAATKTDDNEMFEKLLPRISYEMVAMNYDPNRKLTNKQFMKPEPVNGSYLENRVNRVKVPVPYNLDFSVYIQTKNLNDGWQIVEQILPFFTPAYTVRVRHYPTVVSGDSELTPHNEYDMPVVLTASTWADDYAGDMNSSRTIEWSLEFQVKIHLFGPVSGLPKVIYDARSIIAGSSNSEDLTNLDRTSDIYGGEAGYVSIDSDTVQFTNDSDVSPFVINTLMDSDGQQIRVIREFNIL